MKFPRVIIGVMGKPKSLMTRVERSTKRSALYGGREKTGIIKVTCQSQSDRVRV